MDFVLTSQGLTKNYGKFRALDGLSIHVPNGSIYGLIGRNGAGKTTLIRLICGLQEPDSGEYFIYGKRNSDADISAIRKRMGAVVETPSVYLGMSAEENLKMQYRVLGMPSFDGIRELLKLVDLDKAGRKHAGHFSLGMRQRLGIAVALCGNPDFLILDEPINGLDPQGIIEIRELILKLNRERKITVLISSHILEELSKLATHYGIIDSGKLVKEISSRELENAFRKSVTAEVTNTSALAETLDKMGVEYKILDETHAEIYAKINVTELALALSEKGCDIISLHENEESLESYFLDIVGGDNND